MAFRARKVFGTFEKRAPGLLFQMANGSPVPRATLTEKLSTAQVLWT